MEDAVDGYVERVAMMESVRGHRERYDVVIVGGGFSGVMVAINAAQKSRQPLRVAIIERKDDLGRGIAFASTPRDALLNVPAGSMGAFPDQADDFVNWLRSLSRSAATEVDPSAYYPRHLYGAYLASLLSDAERAGHDISSICANVVDMARFRDGIVLKARDGSKVATAGQVVLALGGPPPADIVDGIGAMRSDPRYVGDPWVFLKRRDFDTQGEILIVGSGLTALDVISGFADTGYSNRLVVVSRNGRFPQSHVDISNAPINPISTGERPTTIRRLTAIVRSEIRRATESGRDWRCVIDGLRPEIQSLWIGFSLEERQRFLRHVRAIYDPHRHRAPAAVLEAKNRLVSAGRLRLLAGRVEALRSVSGAIEATVLERKSQQRETIRAAQVINCGGPGNRYSVSHDPLIVNLLRRGEIAAHATGIGLDALADGRLINAQGTAQRDLYAIGWPMRGVLFETTAVRELRLQARILAETLIASGRVHAPTEPAGIL